MQLSKDFELTEFTVSQTAARLGVENIPDANQIESLRKLCVNVLQPFRDIVDMPIIINSGFRCDQLNALIGGASRSQHTKGEAADIIVPRMGIEEAFELLTKSLEFDQAILEFNSWIHISYVDPNSGDNRGQRLIALNDLGKIKYIPYEDNEIK